MSNFFEPLPQPCRANAFVSEYVDLIVSNFDKHGHSLIGSCKTKKDQARAIWEAPFVVLAHNANQPPLFAYGNRCGLEIFEMDWQQLITCHSHRSAEPEEREERARLLREVADNGIIHHYSGIRISSTGKRFQIDNATICNLWDGEQYVGQAAVFKEWTPLTKKTIAKP